MEPLELIEPLKSLELMELFARGRPLSFPLLLFTLFFDHFAARRGHKQRRHHSYQEDEGEGRNGHGIGAAEDLNEPAAAQSSQGGEHSTHVVGDSKSGAANAGGIQLWNIGLEQHEGHMSKEAYA